MKKTIPFWRIGIVLWLALSPALADAVAVVPQTGLSLSKDSLRAGETLDFTLNIKNTFPDPMTINFSDPYLMFPEIRNASNERAAFLSPPIDMMEAPKTVTLKPGEVYELAAYQIKFLPPTAEMRWANDLKPFNAGIAQLAPGAYTVRVMVKLVSVNGARAPSFPVFHRFQILP